MFKPIEPFTAEMRVIMQHAPGVEGQMIGAAVEEHSESGTLIVVDAFGVRWQGTDWEVL